MMAFDLVTRRARQALAILLMGLLPGAIYFWGELYLSGYSRNPDGSRDIGHMEKLLSTGAINAFVLVSGLGTVGAGLISLAIVRATGRITAVRLMVIATALGAVIPLSFVGLSALFAHTVSSSWDQLVGPGIAGSVAAFALSAIFSLVAGLPLSGSQPDAPATSRPSFADIVVLGAAATATTISVVWLLSLRAWGMAHPCPNCGG